MPRQDQLADKEQDRGHPDIERGERQAADRHASSGNKDSGIWSRPMALLLGASPSLRLTKLEKKIAGHGHRPNQGANLPAEAEQRSCACGRQHGKHDAADGFGWAEPGTAVDKSAPPSTGAANASPRMSLAITGVPLATASRTRSCKIRISCMAPYTVTRDPLPVFARYSAVGQWRESAMQPNIAGPLNAQCGKCLYWEQHDGVAAMGECKRYPPQSSGPRRGGCPADGELGMASDLERRLVWRVDRPEISHAASERLKVLQEAR